MTTKVSTGGIADSAASTAKIADQAVTAAKLGAVEVGRFYLDSSTTIGTATWSKVPIASTHFNTLQGTFSSNRFTPSRAGKYRVTGRVYLNGVVSSTYGVAIYRNTDAYAYALGTGSGDFDPTVSDVLDMNGTTDYIELWAYHGSSNTVTGSASPAPHTAMTIEYLGT